MVSSYFVLFDKKQKCYMTKYDPYGLGTTGWDSNIRAAQRFANRSQVEHYLKYYTDKPENYIIEEVDR